MKRDIIELTMAEFDTITKQFYASGNMYDINLVSIPNFKLLLHSDDGNYSRLYSYDIITHTLIFEQVSMIKAQATFEDSSDGIHMQLDEIYSDHRYKKWWTTPVNEYGFNGHNPLTAWCLAFFIIQWYLFNLPTMFVKETIVKKKRIGKAKRKSGHSQNIVQLVNHYRLSSDFSKQIENHIKFNCPKWSVRGHKRHLKDGREIIVKPYYKGRERNNPAVAVSKTYIKGDESNG